jgi:hypothetical protein
MKLTLTDKNGNQVLAVESSVPSVSTEAVDPGLIIMGTLLAAVWGACGIAGIKEHLDNKKLEAAEKLLKQNRTLIQNSSEFKNSVKETKAIATSVAKLHQQFNDYFKAELEKLCKENPNILKHKSLILKGLVKPKGEKEIQKEISEAILGKYLGKTDYEKNCADCFIYIYDYEYVSAVEEWDDIWPDIDEMIYNFKMPTDVVSKKIGLEIEDSGWEVRMFKFDVSKILTYSNVDVSKLQQLHSQQMQQFQTQQIIQQNMNAHNAAMQMHNTAHSVAIQHATGIPGIGM